MRLSTFTALLSTATATAATAVRRSESDSHPTPTPTGSGSGSGAISTPSPHQDGMAPNCRNFYYVKPSDSCGTVMARHNMTLSQMQAWNPAVGRRCENLWAEYWVCVGVLSNEPPSSGSSHGTSPPAPTQAGVVADCDSWYVARAGDRCDEVLRRYVDLDMPRFMRWNPAVGADCQGLWDSYAYCVGTPDHPARPVDPTACTRSHPQPTQPGALCQCKTWRFLKSGDTCWSVSHERNITEDDIRNWNPGSNCNLWADYYLCVGM